MLSGAVLVGAGGLAWFVGWPLPGLACAAANGSLNQPASWKTSACERACEHGSARACVYLGDLYEAPARARATNPLGDDAAAAQSACARGDASGCRRLGEIYSGDDMSFLLDAPGRAAEAFARGCELGDACTCGLLADLYASGRGVSADQARARALTERACDSGCARACRRLAYECAAAHDDCVTQYWERGCILGDDHACKEVEETYLWSTVTTPPDPRLVDAMAGACLRSGVLNCSCFAEMLLGDGVASDAERARDLVESACARGDYMGCLEAAVIAAHARPDDAARFLERGCRLEPEMTFDGPSWCHVAQLEIERGGGSHALCRSKEG